MPVKRVLLIVRIKAVDRYGLIGKKFIVLNGSSLLRRGHLCDALKCGTETLSLRGSRDETAYCRFLTNDYNHCGELFERAMLLNRLVMAD